jgi:hypothetical protein
MAQTRRLSRARRSSRALGAAGFAAATVSSAAWLSGCAGSAPARRSAPSAATAAPAPPLVSHEFGGLLLAPFGTPFKDVSVPLTEVLVFHQADGTRGREDGDCFRPNVVVSFLGRAPTDHLLCFDHDRLEKIEAAVALPAAEASALFAAACADWQRGVATAGANAGAAGTARAAANAAAAATAPGPDSCEGQQQDIAFSAHRAEGPDPDTATVSITLTSASPPGNQ